MKDEEYQNSDFLATKRALFFTDILSEPLKVLYNSLVLALLCRYFHASLLQITLFTTLKPVLSLFSFYWSFWFKKSPHLLVKKTLITELLARVPFFIIPFTSNTWVAILCFASYMTFSQGVKPAWVELLKRNIAPEKRAFLFSLSSGVSFLLGTVLGLSFGILLDKHQEVWRILLPSCALISCIGIFFQSKIPEKTSEQSVTSLPSVREIFIQPWKESLLLLSQRPDFRFFQYLFMLAGSSLMLLIPVTPILYTQTLNLSYTEIAVAIALFKGLGFALSSTSWSHILHRKGLFFTIQSVFFIIGLYPLFLLFTFIHPSSIFLACFIYGIGQAGSRLSWTLSGSFFAQDEESNRFTEINIVSIALRGAIMPSIGSLLLFYANPITVCLTSLLLCWGAALLSYNNQSLHIFKKTS